MKKEVVIIGAGLVGSLLSIYLSRRGYQVKIYERRADMRKEDMVAGRSINLALSDRGIKALTEVGLMDEIRKICIPMHGRFMHNSDGTTAYQPYGKEGQFINSVSRGELNCRLMDLAEQNGAEITFNQRCESIDWNKNEIHFQHVATGQHATDNPHGPVSAQLVFGSDGAFSAARLTHHLQHDRFQYNQYYIDFGYKELNIPAVENGTFLLEKNALHIWPRGNYMMIALPNIDGSFTCTLFFPFEGETSFASLDTKEKLRSFFEKTFTDAAPLMPTLEKDFFNNPTGSLVTVKCFPWIRQDKFALIGDAAHAMVPFFGQGMNCGFEDCSVLNSLIDEHNENWSEILAEYQTLRKPDGDAICDLALNNFVEMRDKVADPKFLLQKKIEAAFSKKNPGKWIPLYSQVTFSPQIRYSEALVSGQKQEAIMQQIMELPDIDNRWQDEEIEKMILDKLKG
ncbi:MAG: NAD(P)/FAD-dependent oxidoreductase [Ferruginibacter sp.]